MQPPESLLRTECGRPVNRDRNRSAERFDAGHHQKSLAVGCDGIWIRGRRTKPVGHLGLDGSSSANSCLGTRLSARYPHPDQCVLRAFAEARSPAWVAVPISCFASIKLRDAMPQARQRSVSAARLHRTECIRSSGFDSHEAHQPSLMNVREGYPPRARKLPHGTRSEGGPAHRSQQRTLKRSRPEILRQPRSHAEAGTRAYRTASRKLDPAFRQSKA